jgi:hypothetical protein
VDTVEFDQSFECDCEGSAFVGDNCDVEDLPQLEIETNFAQFVRELPSVSHDADNTTESFMS